MLYVGHDIELEYLFGRMFGFHVREALSGIPYCKLQVKYI